MPNESTSEIQIAFTPEFKRAEYNIWTDPEAASIVFASGLPVTMVGWDVSIAYAVMTPADVEAVRKAGTELAAFCTDIQGHVTDFSTGIGRCKGEPFSY